MLKVIVFGLAFMLMIVGAATSTMHGQTVSQNVLGSTRMAVDPLPPSLTLLGGGARWAAHNGSNALYVDWKDNWATHHSTDGSSWGPWPLEQDMDDMRFSVAYALEQFGFNVQFAGDVPDNLTGYDVVIIYAYWAVEPSQCSLIQNYLANGGGVVLLAGVPEFFRCYCKDWWTYRCSTANESLGMQEWFGADAYLNTGGYANVTVDNPFGTGLSAGESLIQGSGYSNAAEDGLHDATQLVAAWGAGYAFAFTHEYGPGRVFYQATFENIPSITIENLTIDPATPNYDEATTVTVTIKDGVGVDQALLAFTINGVWHNVTMNKNGEDYSATIPGQPYGTQVQYRIYANETDGRWTVSPTPSYIVADLVPPEISDVNWTPVDSQPSGSVRVTANITEPADASGVKGAFLSYVDYLGQTWNGTMTHDNTSGLWEVVMPAQPHNTTVQFSIMAQDNAGNVVTSGNYEYPVVSEFPSIMVLPLFMLPTMLVVVLLRRRNKTQF